MNIKVVYLVCALPTAPLELCVPSGPAVGEFSGNGSMYLYSYDYCYK